MASPPSSRDRSSPGRSSLPESPTYSDRPTSMQLDGVPSPGIGEQSPLLTPQPSNERTPFKPPSSLETSSWDGGDEHGEETRSTWYLVLLTLGSLGLQIAWSVETSHFSPYLLSLGLSKSLLALVWIAGPLSGTLVQPYVGVKSDNCKISWGRRKPFIVGGGIATVISMLLLAWAQQIVGGILSVFGVDWESEGSRTCVIIFAVAFVYILDFAINVIQAGIRAFIVDCAPTHQQEDANAWFIRASGVGNILGFLAGFVKLPQYLPFLGNTQFRVLCAIASLVLLITVAISCGAIKERNPQLDGPSKANDGGVLAFFRDIFNAIKRLPPQIRNVCIVQFFAWIGWFPFLFYITTWVGGIYSEPFWEENPNRNKKEIDEIWEKATRVGSLALLIFALTTFAASVVLPWFIVPIYQPPTTRRKQQKGSSTPLTPTTPSLGTIPNSSFRDSVEESELDSPRLESHPQSRLQTRRQSPSFVNRVSRAFNEFLVHIRIPGLTLRRAWLLSHILFAICMFLTFFSRDVYSATIIIGIIGIPWAVTNWAPFALISAEVSKRDAIRRGLIRPKPGSSSSRLAVDAEDEAADQAGVVLGLHNVAIAAPQVIATLGSSLIFRALQKDRGTPGDESVAWVLRVGGLCALIAAWWNTKVGNGDEDIE